MTRRITLIKPSDMFRMLDNSLSLSNNSLDPSNTTKNHSSIEINIVELPDKYEIQAKVPGFTKKEIDISFSDNSLIIEGNKSSENTLKQGNVIVQEFTSSSFKRTIQLSFKVDVDKSEAILKDGIMTISIPKLPETLKKINIK